MAGYFCHIEKCGACDKTDASIVTFDELLGFAFWCKECWEEEIKEELDLKSREE